MALIDFPNVPISPGVPDVRRAATGVLARTGILGEIQALDQFGILDALRGLQYGVLVPNTSNPAIEPDSVISFQYRGEEKIATHPVEGGDFASYNKVTMPFDIQMTLSCNGQGPMTRNAFLSIADQMKRSTDTYDIITPDQAYMGANLVSVDYQRTAQNGVQMVLVTMRFQEVRQTATATVAPTAEPSGAPNQPGGTVKVTPLDRPLVTIFEESPLQ